jgi:hypothetical protein
LSLTSATEMKKPAARRAVKSQSLQQPSDCLWDTLKAQILHKISISLRPSIIDFDCYTVLFYISRVILKPGMPLTTPQEHAFMIEQVQKAKNLIVNLTVTENEKDLGDEGDKENKADVEDNGGRSKKSKVRKLECIPVFVIEM